MLRVFALMLRVFALMLRVFADASRLLPDRFPNKIYHLTPGFESGF
jgi:hypothetical protein